MQLRALLFDKDGTFLDFAKTWDAATGSVINTLAEGDGVLAERLAEIVHYDLEARVLLPTSPFIASSVGELIPLWAEALGRPGDATLEQILRDLFHDATRCPRPCSRPATGLASSPMIPSAARGRNASGLVLSRGSTPSSAMIQVMAASPRPDRSAPFWISSASSRARRR